MAIIGKKNFTSPPSQNSSPSLQGSNSVTPGNTVTLGGVTSSSTGGSAKTGSVIDTRTLSNPSLPVRNVSGSSGAPVKPMNKSPGTPSLPPKKAYPTILDYANSVTSDNGSMDSLSRSNSKSFQQGPGSIPQPNIIDLVSPNKSGSGHKLGNSATTWDHKASDILRSSIANEVNKLSPQKPIVQRQNSNPISSAQVANSYLAQFASFANATPPITLLKSSSSTTAGNSQNSAMNLSSKSDHQYFQQAEIERQKQILKLNEHQLKMIEKAKQQHVQQQQQQQQQQQNQQQQPQPQRKVAKVITITKQSVKPSQSNQQGSQPQSQSAMNMVVNKKVSPTASKISPAQVNSQFSKYSEALIRQQLSEGVSVNKYSLPSPTEPQRHERMQLTSEQQLRKTSPHAQQSVSQGNHGGKPSLAHMQSHGLSQTSPVSKPVATMASTTNGGGSSSGAATSLLKSLFGQMSNQSNSQSFSSPPHIASTQRSPTQPPKSVVSPGAHVGQKQWSPGVSVSQMVAGGVAGAHVAKSHPYVQTSPGLQQMPSFHGVKLTPDQLAAYQGEACTDKIKHCKT